MKKVVVVASSMRFKNAISESLNCGYENIEFVYSPKEFLDLIKVADPELIILDYNYVGKEDLFGYYTFTRWFEIQMVVTDFKNKFNFKYLLN